MDRWGRGRAGAGMQRDGHRAPPPASQRGAAYHLERDAGLSFPPPAHGHAAACPDGRRGPRRPQAPLEGSTRPAAARRTRRTGEPHTPAAPPDRMLTHSSIHRIISLDREGHNNWDLPRFHNNPPPKKGRGVLKKKRQGFLTLFFPPSNPAFNQKNKA